MHCLKNLLLNTVRRRFERQTSIQFLRYYIYIYIMSNTVGLLEFCLLLKVVLYFTNSGTVLQMLYSVHIFVAVTIGVCYIIMSTTTR